MPRKKVPYSQRVGSGNHKSKRGPVPTVNPVAPMAQLRSHSDADTSKPFLDENMNAIVKAEEKPPEPESLFPVEALEEITVNGKKLKRYTGENLFKSDPDRYKAIVRAISEPGIPDSWIKEWFHVDVMTITSIRMREDIAIEKTRKQIGHLLRHGTKVAAETIMENFHLLEPRDQVRALEVFADKFMMLDGRPAEEHKMDISLKVTHTPPEDEFKKYLEAFITEMPSANPKETTLIEDEK